MAQTAKLGARYIAGDLATVTWAHHSLIARDRKGVIYGLIFTIILALVFTALQGYEYYNAPFTIADSVYGSCFYFGTGLMSPRGINMPLN
jgi:cytochrome c oxidase subunit 3